MVDHRIEASRVECRGDPLSQLSPALIAFHSHNPFRFRTADRTRVHMSGASPHAHCTSPAYNWPHSIHNFRPMLSISDHSEPSRPMAHQHCSCLGCLQKLCTDAVVVQLSAYGHNVRLCRQCREVQVADGDRDSSDLPHDGDGTAPFGITLGWPVNRCPECRQTFLNQV